MRDSPGRFTIIINYYYYFIFDILSLHYTAVSVVDAGVDGVRSCVIVMQNCPLPALPANSFQDLIV